MPDRHASFATDSDDGEDAPVEQPMRRWQVLLPLPLDGAYDYLAPESWRIAPGSFVSVPLGSRTLAGVVWAEGRADGGRQIGGPIPHGTGPFLSGDERREG